MPSLIVVRGQQPGRILPLRHEAILGRGSKAELNLPDPSLSRLHCRLERVENRWQITDLQSTNGVYVNGQHVRQSQILNPGDLITLGHVQLLFSLEDGTPAQPREAETERNRHNHACGTLVEIDRQLEELPTVPPPQPAHFQPLAPLLAQLATPLQRLVLIWHDLQRDRLLTLVQGGDSPLQARLDLPLLQFACTWQKTIVSISADTDPRLPVKLAAEKLGFKSLICVPVLQGKQVTGLLLADSTQTEEEAAMQTCLQHMQLLARLLQNHLTGHPAESGLERLQHESGLKAWQKRHLDCQPPFLPGLQWLQSHQHAELMQTALYYGNPDPHRHLLLAMDAQGQHHPRLRNLLLDELVVWLEASLPRHADFSSLAEALVHRSLGLPVNLRWCLLELDAKRRHLRWHNQQLHILELNGMRVENLPEQGERTLHVEGPAVILGNRSSLETLPWASWPELAPALLSRADAALAGMEKPPHQPDHFLVILQPHPPS